MQDARARAESSQQETIDSEKLDMRKELLDRERVILDSKRALLDDKRVILGQKRELLAKAAYSAFQAHNMAQIKAIAVVSLIS